MVKLIRKTISFTTADGQKVKFTKKVRPPPKTTQELERRLKKVPPALRKQAKKLWRAAHPRAGKKK